MKNRRNYYRILQIQPDAPFEVIRASYRALLKELKLHPDLGGEHWNAQILNEAYMTLSDVEKRRDYDRMLFKKYTKRPFEKASEKSPLITLFCPFCKRPLAREAQPDEACPSCRAPLKSLNEDDLKRTCRRSIKRRKKAGSIRYFTTWPQKSRTGEMVDVSPEGMRFRCMEKLREKAIIKISSNYLKAIAEVRECHKILLPSKTTYSVGVHFMSVTFLESKGSFYSKSV